ncbi:hypothetical protein GGR53DRAFT_135693 [Hypoxylon sp. FL1150]|nr:hypothetical protein GGR53DRAFT_135693 [Hypoxylon sp. FL1150]
MKPSIFIALLLAWGALAAPALLPVNKYKNTILGNHHPSIYNEMESASCDEEASELRKRKKLQNRDNITQWNFDHQENQIAAYYTCPDMLRLYTAFDDMSVWEAFQQALWYHGRKGLLAEDQPRWSGLDYPHPIWLADYHARDVDLGHCNGNLFAFPLNPGQVMPWPGIRGWPITGPPGNHRIIYDDKGLFAGVAIIYRGDSSERLGWCYPIYADGARHLGATGDGVSGVDEAWIDSYDGHFLFAPNPAAKSNPPGPDSDLK